MPANEVNKGRGRGQGHSPRGQGRSPRGQGRSPRGQGRSPSSSPTVRATREQRMHRRRAAELARVLLPDAPPNKRRRRAQESPERMDCLWLEVPAISNQEVVVLEDGPMVQVDALGAVVEDAAVAEDSALAEDGPVLEDDAVKKDGPVLEDGMGAASSTQDVEIELVVLKDGPLLEDSEGAASSMQHAEIVIDAPEMESVIGRWLSLDESEDEDLDDDDETDVNLLPVLLATRTAADQPADVVTSLSSAEVEILQREDEASDLHLQGVASSEDYFTFDWRKEREVFHGTREIFTGTPGPTFPMKDLKPIDIFYKMFDDSFVDLLVNETNRYAAQSLKKLITAEVPVPYSRLLRWKPTNRDEMVTLLAVMILQGLYPKVKEEAYFSYDGYGTTPHFASIMSYNRYYLLKTFLHFVDNESKTDFTKLNKIRPVIDYLNAKFASLYYPQQEVVIDESLLKWQGRLSFAQKIKTKAAKVGVKTYELCESSSGYLWKFIVYTGKDGPNKSGQDDPLEEESDGRETFDATDGQVRPTNATGKIVYDLIEPLLHRGHTLIMDNFYNCPLLARCLKRDGQTDVYGTLRLNREFVPESIKSLSKLTMRQGEVVATYCSDLSVILWRDFNFVGMISTYHPLEIGTKGKCDRKVFKPAVVLDYNKSMGGVDRKDQYLASQPLERHRNKVWYKKLFRRLFNAAVFNCFVIYTSNQTNKVSHRVFRTRLAEDLLLHHKRLDLKVAPKLLPLPPVRPPSVLSKSRLAVQPCYVETNHFPAKSQSSSTTCWWCARQKPPKRSRTSYKCEQCNANLCIIGCFKAFHKIK